MGGIPHEEYIMTNVVWGSQGLQFYGTNLDFPTLSNNRMGWTMYWECRRAYVVPRVQSGGTGGLGGLRGGIDLYDRNI